MSINPAGEGPALSGFSFSEISGLAPSLSASTDGVTNLFGVLWAPFNFIRALILLTRANMFEDTEGQVESVVALSSTPFTIINSLIYLISCGFRVFTAFSYETRALTALTGTGCALATIDLFADGHRIFRQRQFKWLIHPELHKEQHRELPGGRPREELVLLAINTEYFTVDVSKVRRTAIARLKSRTSLEPTQEAIDGEALRVKREWLDNKAAILKRRVSPEVVKKLQAVIDLDATTISKELLATIDTQSSRVLCHHVVGLCLSLIYLAALIAMIAACPPLIPFIVIIIVSILAIGRALFAEGYTHAEKGWFEPSQIWWVKWLKSLVVSSEERQENRDRRAPGSPAAVPLS